MTLRRAARSRVVASLVVAWALVGAASASEPVVADGRIAATGDVDRFCDFVADRYAYFDRKTTDWAATCDDARRRAVNAMDRNALIAILEDALDQLYDPHANLGTSTRASHRLVPTDSDVHAVWRDGRAIIVDVRRMSSADAAGLRDGMEIIGIAGDPVATAVAHLAPRHLRGADPSARDWALDVALAGRQDGQLVRVTVVDRDGPHDLAYLPDRVGSGIPVTARCIGDVAAIAFDNSLGDSATIAAFDDALASLRCRRALVLDLRDTPSGGNTTVARAVIGRLVAHEAGYQRHERPSELREAGIRHVWIEQVEPRTPTFDGPVVVLVGHWTGSMGEGIAIGLDASRGAPVVGRPMAGLHGALDETTLPGSGIVVRIPAERLSHVDGTPREAFRPCAIPSAAPTDAADDELVHAVALARAARAARTITPANRAARTAASCPQPARR